MKIEEISKIYDLSLVSNEAEEFVGLAAKRYLQMKEKGVPLQQGFVLTTKVFDDFLILNNLVEYIVERLTEIQAKPSLIERNSKAIRSKILAGNMPEYLNGILPGFLKKFSGQNRVLVDLQSSVYNEELEASLAESQIYQKSLSDIDSIFQGIKELWVGLFDSHSLRNREIAMYEGPLSMAVIISKSPIVEISGKAITNSLGRDNLIEVEAVMGDIELIKKDEFLGDRYVVDIQDSILVEKNIVEQKKMYVTSFGNKGLKKEKLTISKPWRNNPKLQDSQAVFIGLITHKVKEVFQKEVEIEFGIEMGKPIVTYIKEIGNDVRKQPDASSHLEILKSKIERPETFVKAETPKESNIKNTNEIIGSNNNEVINVDQSGLGDLNLIESDSKETIALPDLELKKVNKPKPISEYVDEIKQEIKPSKTKIDITNIEPVEEIKSGIELFVQDYNLESIVKYSKNIDGFVNLSGDQFIASYKKDLNTIIQDPKKFILGLIDYLSSGLEETHEPSIYEFISNSYRKLNLGLGANAILKDNTIFTYELEAIRKIRNSMQKKNLWISVPYIRNVSEFLEVKKIISINRLRRSPTFKIYASIDNTSSALLIEDIIEAGADGFIFDFDNLYQNVLGGFEESSLPLEGMSKLIIGSLKIANQYKIKSIAKGVDIKKFFGLQELIDMGFSSISSPATQIIDFKKEISIIEMNRLKRK